MKRILFLLVVMIVGTAQADRDTKAPARAPAGKECAINVDVSRADDLWIAVPCFDRDQLAQMVAILFARGDEKAKQKFTELLSRSRHLTLVVSTRRD